MGYTSDGSQTGDDEVAHRLAKPDLGWKNEERRLVTEYINDFFKYWSRKNNSQKKWGGSWRYMRSK